MGIEKIVELVSQEQKILPALRKVRTQTSKAREKEILISKSWMKIDCFQISAVDTFRAFANYDSSNKYIFQNLTKSASVHSSQNGQRKRAKNGQSLSCKGPKLRKCAIKLQKKPKYDYRLFLMPEKEQINKDLPVDYGD